jgi:hypothetical protein
MAHAAQERFVAAVAVINSSEQLIARQLARIGERLPQLSREYADLLTTRIRFPGPADEIVVAA